MKNLKPYKEDTISFHKSVIEGKNSTKKDPEYKTRVSKHNDLIKQAFVEYKNFKTNTLHLLKSINFVDNDKKDLQFLYSFSSKALQKLKMIRYPQTRK